MTRRAIAPGLALLLVCSPLAAATAERNLFVSPSGAWSGTGTAADPFARLTDAVARVRELHAAGDTDTITIHVAPGRYLVSRVPQDLVTEPLPIVVDVSDVKILGATELALDPETNTPISALPGESVLVAAQTLVGGEGMILLTPDAGGHAPHGVRISGLTLDGVGFGGQGMFVDRAQEFLIHGNVATRFVDGVRTRDASGDLRGNLMLSNQNTGMTITAGSNVSPAVVRITENRAGGSEIGILLVATGTNALASPNAAPITAQFDPAVDADTIPNRLTASVRNNVMSSNTIAGLRVFAVGQLQNSYSLLNATRYETFVSLDSRGNRYFENTYGISLDAGFPRRSSTLAYTSVIDARFRDEVPSNNVTANAFFGFVRLQVATGVASPVNFEPLSGATLTVDADEGLLQGLNFSHPATDSIGGASLANRLIVNGVEVPNGACIGVCPDPLDEH